MESAVDVQRLSRAIIQQSVRNSANRPRDIVRFAHSALRQQAVGDLLLVRGGDTGNHVCSYDAWLDLENSNTYRCKARREQLGGHAEPGLGDAILASIHRGSERGDR